MCVINVDCTEAKKKNNNLIKIEKCKTLQSEWKKTQQRKTDETVVKVENNKCIKSTLYIWSIGIKMWKQQWISITHIIAIACCNDTHDLWTSEWNKKKWNPILK